MEGWWDFVATFTTDGYQHIGFGVDFNSAPWAIFSTGGGGGSLLARSNGDSGSQEILISGNWLGTPPHYRIDWNSTNIVYWIDGVQVATQSVAISTAMRPLISDLLVGGQKLVVDWMHMSPYSTPATFTSRVLDAGAVVPWTSISWTADQPTGTSLAMSVRTGNTPVPDGSWTSFTAVATSGTALTGSSRYIQYQATLSTTDTTQTVVLRDVTFTFGPSGPDTTPPSVSISSPTANQTVTGTIPVTATASDNVAVASVQFKLDGANLGSLVTSAPYQISWNTTSATNASHSLTAVATDTSNNSTTSTAVAVTVNNDTTPPSVSISSPTANQTVTGTIPVTATASDNVAVASVQFKLDGANLGAPVTSAPYQISWNTTSATNASHSLTAVATDTSNNSTTSTAVAVTVNNDTTPPSVSISSPTANQTVTGTIPVTATASDNVAVASVQFKLDGANLGAPVTSAPYQISWNTTSATNASHSLTAVATDTSNNSTTSTAVAVTVNNDTTPPSVSISSPTANQTVTGTIPVTATASDNVAVASVQFKLDGANLGAPVTSAPYQINWNTTSATNASHSLTAVATDTSNNSTTSTAVAVTVNNDTTPPSVSISSPTANQTVTGTIPVTATASDNVAVASVQFKLDGANLGAPVTSAPYQINWNTTSATNASHSLTAVATDTSNNSTTSTAVAVTVNNDTTPPSVSISSPTANQTVTGTIPVTATASDNVAVASVQFKLDGANLGAPVTSAPYQINWNTTSATNASHSLTAVATDTSNNSTTSTAVAVTVNNDTTPPSVSISSPTANQTVTGTIPVTATASDNVAVASVQFKLDGANLGALVTSAPYQISWNTTSATNASPPRTAVATDTSNNSTTSTAVAVTVSNASGGGGTSGSLTDTLVSDFSAGTGTNTYVSQIVDGEVIQLPTAGTEFSGTAIPNGWTVNNWNSGGSAVVNGGTIAVDGALVGTSGTYSQGRSLDFVATFTTDGSQHIGFGVDFNSAPWAIFSTGGGGGSLLARSNGDSGSQDILISGNWLGTPHHYRIDWNATNIVYWIDGVQVATQSVAISTAMRPLISDLLVGGQKLVVDWMHMSPYRPPATFTSRVLDAGAVVPWTSISWTADQPTGTSLAMSVRTGNTPVPDGSWTSFTAVATSGTALTGSSRYIQYQATLSTTDTTQTVVLRDVTITFGPSGPDTTPPSVSISSPTANQTVTGTIPVTATASDNVAVASVQFKLDGANLGAPVTSAPYQISWNTTSASNASHSLTAVATDTSNNSTTSTAVAVTVNNDTTPPSVSISSPTANQTVAGTIPVTATASDNVAVASVQFKLDGANLGAPVTSAPYQINWNTTSATNASHSLTAVATDTSNNSTTSTAVAVTGSNARG